ncbi:MAG: nucleotide exchange factor GrpE [Desulfitobacterium hafniense]|nr:nucleotide exchange factor GrpE [Desulfitobacterium hafniense]
MVNSKDDMFDESTNLDSKNSYPGGEVPGDDKKPIPEEESLDKAEMTSEERYLTLEAELAQAKAQAGDYYSHLQRLQAEFDNYRKRTQKEKEDTSRFASERILVELLPILDNFERAVDAAQTNQDFKAFSQGVEMILRQMQKVLEKEGLTPIDPVGKPFDPNLHEAVLQVESEDHPENIVVEELQRGYYLKEKVLRPSMVKVSC